MPGLGRLHTSFADKEVSGVWIDSLLDRAVFIEKTDNDELEFNIQYEVILAGEPTAYGAMFASDHFMYECILQRAFAKMAVVSDINARRAKEFKEALPDRPECHYPVQGMDAVKTAAAALGNSRRLAGHEPAVAEALSVIKAAQGELQRQNDVLLRQSCPELY
jgi:hypothetical protein